MPACSAGPHEHMVHVNCGCTSFQYMQLPTCRRKKLHVQCFTLKCVYLFHLLSFPTCICMYKCTKAWLCSDTAKRNYHLITPEGWGGRERGEEEGKAIILTQSLVFSAYQFHIYYRPAHVNRYKWVPSPFMTHCLSISLCCNMSLPSSSWLPPDASLIPLVLLTLHLLLLLLSVSFS